MANVTRQPKPTRKGAPEPARRTQATAWTGTRASPTFTPGNSSPRPANGPPPGNFPPLAQPNGNRVPDASVLQAIAGFRGASIILLTRTAQRYEGTVLSTNGEGDTTGVTLKDVKELSNPGAPPKDQLFIASTNIESWNAGSADARVPNGESFRTDSDITKTNAVRRDRELQAWQPNPDPVAPQSDEPPAPGPQLGQGDDVTFGPGAKNTQWDQFAVNEKLFGVKTNFDEDVYTTRLDRSAADFKERERKAQKIANEITGVATNNPHVAEERTVNIVDDSGMDEEDKYGAVVRGSNAYVPPGARKQNASAATPANAPKTEIPKVSVNAPDGAVISPPQVQSPQSSSKSPSPVPTNSTKPPADALPAFRDFVTNEKQRLSLKRQALVKSDMDKRMAELVKFGQTFKLNKPIPDDLVPILAKDEEKQKLIREKAHKDAASAQARSIGVSSSVVIPSPSASRFTAQPAAKLGNDPTRKPGGPVTPLKTASTTPAISAQKAPTAAKTPASSQPAKPAGTGKQTISMYIQAIPPFKGSKGRTQSSNSSGNNASVPNGSTQLTVSTSAAAVPSTPASPTTANNRLNVNASSFRPNPKANAFSPVQGASSPNPSASSASASVSPKPKSDTIPSTPNPFFGTRPIKKSAPVNVKDDFNPFKHNKVAEASAVAAMWPYSGKRYMHMFPPPQHQPQQHSPHIAPPGPPPIPPPSYEEDQAATRGYVYAYPPYGYPGQPMMPGMPPPPPGAYMPGPFMQPMPYPPGMVPPNGQPMYAPAMGQMPPPQAYMPPPPGTYPPPPNGAGPRPSIPPTPIPTHAHPYYHQSPQLQHAVPYPMMMPPSAPPNGPPHVYDSGPAQAVPMGHA